MLSTAHERRRARPKTSAPAFVINTWQQPVHIPRQPEVDSAIATALAYLGGDGGVPGAREAAGGGSGGARSSSGGHRRGAPPSMFGAGRLGSFGGSRSRPLSGSQQGNSNSNGNGANRGPRIVCHTPRSSRGGGAGSGGPSMMLLRRLQAAARDLEDTSTDDDDDDDGVDSDDADGLTDGAAGSSSSDSDEPTVAPPQHRPSPRRRRHPRASASLSPARAADDSGDGMSDGDDVASMSDCSVSMRSLIGGACPLSLSSSGGNRRRRRQQHQQQEHAAQKARRGKATAGKKQPSRRPSRQVSPAGSQRGGSLGRAAHDADDSLVIPMCAVASPGGSSVDPHTSTTTTPTTTSSAAACADDGSYPAMSGGGDASSLVAATGTPRLVLLPRPRTQPRLTVVLDLDETLIRWREEPIYVRPYARMLFETLKMLPGVEVVIWTCATDRYARRALEHVPGAFWHHIVSRDRRWYRDGAPAVKCLEWLGRDVSRCMQIDNCPVAVSGNPDNCIVVQDIPECLPRVDETLKHVTEAIAHVIVTGEPVPTALKSCPYVSVTAFRVADDDEVESLVGGGSVAELLQMQQADLTTTSGSDPDDTTPVTSPNACTDGGAFPGLCATGGGDSTAAETDEDGSGGGSGAGYGPEKSPDMADTVIFVARSLNYTIPAVIPTFGAREQPAVRERMASAASPRHGSHHHARR